jgi:hypothetical protein
VAMSSKLYSLAHMRVQSLDVTNTKTKSLAARAFGLAAGRLIFLNTYGPAPIGSHAADETTRSAGGALMV